MSLFIHVALLLLLVSVVMIYSFFVHKLNDQNTKMASVIGLLTTITHEVNFLRTKLQDYALVSDVPITKKSEIEEMETKEEEEEAPPAPAAEMSSTNGLLEVSDDEDDEGDELAELADETANEDKAIFRMTEMDIPGSELSLLDEEPILLRSDDHFRHDDDDDDDADDEEDEMRGKFDMSRSIAAQQLIHSIFGGLSSAHNMSGPPGPRPPPPFHVFTVVRGESRSEEAEEAQQASEERCVELLEDGGEGETRTLDIDLDIKNGDDGKSNIGNNRSKSYYGKLSIQRLKEMGVERGLVAENDATKWKKQDLVQLLLGSGI